MACCTKGFVLLVIAANATFGATLEIDIRNTFSDKPLLLDSLRYPYSVTRLSYLLTRFALEAKAGNWIELPGQFAWMDAGKHRSSVTLSNVPAGEYRALRFVVGVTETNDPASYPSDHPLNPNLNGLHWSWLGGYIALAIEGRNGNDGFSFHLARRTTTVTLPTEFGSDAALAVAFNVAALLKGVEVTGSTHSRDGDAVADALRANLAGAFQVRGVARESVVPAAAPVKPLYLPAKYTPYKLTFSGKFPMPALPRDNPLLEERVALGNKLFHEPLLSRNNSISCATCHDEQHAFADPRRFSLGVDGRPGKLNAMPLQNLAWKSRFFWDGRAPSLREQVKFPIQDHLEMDENLTNVCAKLAGKYDFSQAFDNADITPEKITLALENYLLTLTSCDSKFDRAMRGQGKLSAEEKRGFELFFTEYDPRTRQYGADCFHCHGGALFSNFQFLDNGLDAGQFAVPSLRNVALTAPYMHDGRFNTLEEVVEHYSTGVKRSATLDPNLAKHPAAGIQLGEADKQALVAFLKTLTDDRNPVILSARGGN